MRFLRTALRPLARGYATSVTGYGREVEGFVGAVGNTPLVSAEPPTPFHRFSDFLIARRGSSTDHL